MFYQVAFLSAVDDYGAVTSKGALLRFLFRPAFWNYSSSNSPRIINLKPNAIAYVAFLMLMSCVNMLMLMFIVMLMSQVWTILKTATEKHVHRQRKWKKERILQARKYSRNTELSRLHLTINFLIYCSINSNKLFPPASQGQNSRPQRIMQKSTGILYVPVGPCLLYCS